jgi:hypothetical protein
MVLQNYQNLFEHTVPPLRGQFLYPERGHKQTVLTPPPHLVHIVIEWPLMPAYITQKIPFAACCDNQIKLVKYHSRCLVKFVSSISIKN